MAILSHKHIPGIRLYELIWTYVTEVLANVSLYELMLLSHIPPPPIARIGGGGICGAFSVTNRAESFGGFLLTVARGVW
jgi:hypothetical protein